MRKTKEKYILLISNDYTKKYKTMIKLKIIYAHI